MGDCGRYHLKKVQNLHIRRDNFMQFNVNVCGEM